MGGEYNLIFDYETERHVLAACMEGAEYVGEALAEVTVDYFYQREHKAIFEAMAAMYRDGQDITAQTVYIKHSDLIKRLGISWTKYTDIFTNPAAFKAAIHKLKETSKIRELLALSDIIRQDIESGDSAAEVKGKIEIAYPNARVQQGAVTYHPKICPENAWT